MLQHLYTLDYSGHKISIGDEEEPSYVSDLHTHASVYALGDEYGIVDLKEEALWKFKEAMEAKKGYNDELELLIEVIPTVYETTPSSDRGLRDVVVAFGAEKLERMKDVSGFESAVTQAPAYIVEVLPIFLQSLEDEKRQYRGTCGRCGPNVSWSFDRVKCASCGHTKVLSRYERVDAS